jgi:hypothetical protein
MTSQLVDIDIIRAHYDTLIICESIYPDPRELAFAEETAVIFDRWRNRWRNRPERDMGELELDEDTEREMRMIKALRMTVQLNVDEDPDKPLTITASLPLLADESSNGLARLSLQTPAYLSRSDSEKLAQELANVVDEATINGFTARDNASHIMDAGQRLVWLCSELCQAAANTMEEQQKKEEVVEDDGDGELQRVWFWFPSLSTREKRKDLVTYASRWGLTGFVLAGTSFYCLMRHSMSDHELNCVP